MSILNKPVSRRTALFIGASFAASAALGGAAGDSIASPHFHTWRGVALGADASIQLIGVTPAIARKTFKAIETEIARLEAIFSLYKADSILSALNRAGQMTSPPPEMLEVLSVSAAVHRQSGGLFDPTIQPVFDFYAQQAMAAEDRTDQGSMVPPAAVMDLVGLDMVAYDGDRIAFAKPGMALSFNGVAQGYITDKVAHLLKDRGFENMLIDLGEIAAIGRGPHEQGWRVRVRNGDTGQIADNGIFLKDMAIATSALRGTLLGDSGRIGHIFHPQKGFVPAARLQASVINASAALADAWSTAAILMDDKSLANMNLTGLDIRT